jgi:tRNA (guanine37-N1)-methyltransferase
MVMTVQWLHATLPSKSERSYDEIIYMSPDGETLNQKMKYNVDVWVSFKDIIKR